jgi:hypothetical protein
MFFLPGKYWTTDSYVHPIVTRTELARYESNLHDIGNLISFVMSRSTADVEKAILTDPRLVRSTDAERNTPCLVAVACGTPSLVSFIMRHKGDIHAKTATGLGAMYFAVASNLLANLDFVGRRGFSANAPSPAGFGTPLEFAERLHANRSVRWLIDHAANLNASEEGTRTPLRCAIMYANAQAFDMLIAAGANVHLHAKDGTGIMHWAVESPEFLTKALAAGVLVDDRSTTQGETPLMIAALTQSYAAAKWLLDHGAELKARDNRGRDVLDYARRSNWNHTDAFFRRGVGGLKQYGGD